jgi:hypothetical protein
VTYASRWAQAWAVLAAAEVGFASLQWSPVIVMLDLLATGAGVTVCVVMYQEHRMPPTTAPLSRRLAETGRRSLMISLCVVALSTLVTGSPPLAMLVVLLVVVTSPAVVHLRVGRARSDPAPPAARPAAQAPRSDDAILEELDDVELFRLWRQTFWELGTQPNADELSRLVALRQSCLDELARRNPAALHAWLDSGARASGGPERFWRRAQDHGKPGDDR